MAEFTITSSATDRELQEMHKDYANSRSLPNKTMTASINECELHVMQERVPEKCT